MKAFEELHQYFGDQLTIVGIAVLDSPDRVKQYAADHHLRFTLLVDQDNAAVRRYEIKDELPVTMVVGANGEPLEFPDPSGGAPARRFLGPRGWNTRSVVKRLEALVNHEPISQK